jgi:hypothetical protein
MIITGALSGSKVTSPNLVQPGAVKCTPIVVYYAATTQLNVPTVASSPQSRGWLREGPVGGERSDVRHDLVDVELHAFPGFVDRHAAAERVEVEGGQLAHLLGASDDLVGREDLVDPLGP